jgi:predicted N-formylglutamate amidohydrolase
LQTWNGISFMNAFKSFEILDGHHDRGMVLLGDHAMNRLPERYGRLGSSGKRLCPPHRLRHRHRGLVRSLSQSSACPPFSAVFLRLLIDPNRGEDDPTLIMKISDGAIIPGNHPITAEEWNGRIATFHRPYHNAVSQTIDAGGAATGKAPLVLSLHSYTPAWKGVPRPWHAAVLWDSDHRAVAPLLDLLRADPDLVVGDNEPYDGALKGDTMYRHCMMTGIPHALLEVRQDLIGDEAGIAAWAERLAPIFETMNADPALHQYQVHASRTGPYE